MKGPTGNDTLPEHLCRFEEMHGPHEWLRLADGSFCACPGNLSLAALLTAAADYVEAGTLTDPETGAPEWDEERLAADLRRAAGAPLLVEEPETPDEPPMASIGIGEFVSGYGRLTHIGPDDEGIPFGWNEQQRGWPIWEWIAGRSAAETPDEEEGR